MVVMSVIFYYLTDLRKMEGGQGWISAFFLGAILGGTSSAVVIPMVRQLRMGEKGQTVLVLESALSDVLCLVVGLALLDSMQAWEVSFTPLFNKMWQSFLFAIIIGVFAGLFWLMMKQNLAKLKTSLFSTFAFAFLVYGIAELAGFNGGIATLVFGITLGNAVAFTGRNFLKRIYDENGLKLEQHEMLFYSEIVFILQTYFFVYIGVNIRFGQPLTYIIAIVIVVINILMRVATVKILPKKNLDARDRSIMSIMSPKGLVPAVLASIPLYMGISGGDIIQEVAYAVVFTSILVISLLVMIMEIRRKPKMEPVASVKEGFVITHAADAIASAEPGSSDEEVEVVTGTEDLSSDLPKDQQST
jgi:NhaP-type Na+/H+ or K+/H+ antiporter